MSDEITQAPVLMRRGYEPAPRTVEAFGVAFTRPHASPEYDDGNRKDNPLQEALQFLWGAGSARKLTRVRNRVLVLEKLQEQLIDALGQRFEAAIDARLAPIEQRMDAITAIQGQTTAHLHATLKTVHETIQGAIDRIEVLRDDMNREVARIDAALAALPEAWRGDFEARLTELRDSPDGANALLHGAETLAASIARSLDDVETERRT